MLSALAIGAIVYAVAISAALAMPMSGIAFDVWIPEWAAVPAQLLALAATCVRAHAEHQGHRPVRRVWWLLAAFSLGSVVATLVWNLERGAPAVPAIDRADVIYFLDYAAVAAAYLAILAARGVNLRSKRLWFDAVSIYGACLAVMWCAILGPLVPSSAVHVIPWPFAWAYVLCICAPLVTASLVWMNTPWRKANAWILLLALAGVVNMAWEFGYVASWLSDRNFLERFYDYGDVLCFVVVTVAVWKAPRDILVRERHAIDHATHGFVPTLMALPSVALAVTVLAVPGSAANWTLVGLAAACSVLLATRAQLAKSDVAMLTRELIAREANEKVSELVRESDDLLLVVDSGGTLTFASAASRRQVGREPGELIGTQAADIFGPAQRAAMEKLLVAASADASAVATIEVLRSDAQRRPQVLYVTAVDRCAHPRIAGYVLTVQDRSEQRALEQEILRAAHQERVRFAADIHDGVAQQLTGIALILQGELASRGGEGVDTSSPIARAVAHLNGAIGDTRRLIRDAAPLLAVKGKLSGALRQLEGSDEAAQVSIHVCESIDDLGLDEATSDHLWRIAAEAVQNARKHGHCRQIDVTLAANDGCLELVIVDDGAGFELGERRDERFGLKFMEYRARLVGASFSIQSRAGAGTAVAIRMPLGAASRA